MYCNYFSVFENLYVVPSPSVLPAIILNEPFKNFHRNRKLIHKVNLKPVNIFSSNKTTNSNNAANNFSLVCAEYKNNNYSNSLSMKPATKSCGIILKSKTI